MVSRETEALLRASVAADVWRMADAAYWRRRAEAFEWAKPRLDEFYGQRTLEEVRESWRRCHEMAEACRNRAAFAEMGDAA
jgi:hypothetical protein